MKEALAGEQCPLDANLEKVIPGLHNWHKEHHNAMRKLDKKISDGLGTLEQQMKTGFETVVKQVRKESTRTDDRMADMLMEMAIKLRGGGNVDLSSMKHRPRESVRIW